MTIDFDFQEHRTALIIGGCIAVIAASLATGGADRWQTQQATKQADQTGKEAQSRAESIFQEQGVLHNPSTPKAALLTLPWVTWRLIQCLLPQPIPKGALSLVVTFAPVTGAFSR